MADYKVTRRKLTDYQPDPANPNAGTERGLQMIEDSLHEDGFGRSIVADAADRIPAGNGTLQAAVNAGFEDVIEIETDGRAIIVHKRRDWDLSNPAGPARRYSVRDNRASQVGLSWDATQIAAHIGAGLQLDGMFYQNEIGDILANVVNSVDDVTTAAASDGDGNAADGAPITAADVPDLLFPADNVWGVPTLDPNLQATALELPVTKYGTIGRSAAMSGTYHFYTEDYKFTGLWADPTPVLNAGARAVVEPNFSTNNQLPRAIVLADIYRKRWLARFWQMYGVRVFVDLNVESMFFDLNFLGVPREWRAYANRAYVGDADHLEAAYSAACEHHGGADLLYLVIGGRESVEEYCRARGWLWIAEASAVVKRTKGQ